MPKQTKEEEYYEIVPTETYSKSEEKSRKLEKEIDEIRNAIKGSVGVSKFGKTAEEFMPKILELLKNSQKMVKEVSRTNKELSGKLQEALDSMNKTNKLLSNKLTKILDYFSEAAEMEETEGAEIGETISKQMNGVRSALQAIIEQNKQTQHLLKLIEKDLRTQSKKTPSRAPAQQRGPEPRSERTPPQKQRAPAREKPELEEGELPPPPFPPS
ncbi:MAG: hypothetical protein R6U26_03365 [Candidatus Undinarchaeales archaeon]